MKRILLFLKAIFETKKICDREDCCDASLCEDCYWNYAIK